MRLPRGTATKAVATLAIVVGLSVTAIAVGASTTPGATGRALGGSVHANKAVVCTKTTKKPIVTTCKFNASYSGTISIVWNQNGPSTASITGKGKGAEFGLITITGSGSGTASSQSDPINGNGVLSGLKETLHLKLATGTTATGASSSAPTVVTVSGYATVTSGSGTFLHATGKLKVTGEFSIKSTTGHEKDSFSTTLVGTVTIK